MYVMLRSVDSDFSKTSIGVRNSDFCKRDIIYRTAL
jgi:hypothetical protein